MALVRPSRRLMVPMGRQIMASMRASQPELVWGPWWRTMPPNATKRSRAARTPVPRSREPVRSSLRVSGRRGGIGLAAGRLHGVHDHSGDGDVEPDRERIAGELAMGREAAGEREEEGDQD